MSNKMQELDSQGKVIRGEYNTTLPTYANGDVVIPQYDSSGRLIVVGPAEPTIDSYQQVAINLDAAADQVLVASAAGKQIWVYGFGITLSVAGTVSFQDEDNAALTGVMPFAASSGMALNPSGNFSMPIWKLGTDKDLEVDVVTASIDGWLCYAIVSV